MNLKTTYHFIKLRFDFDLEFRIKKLIVRLILKPNSNKTQMSKFVIITGRTGSGKTWFHGHSMPQRISGWDAALAKEVYHTPPRDFWLFGGASAIQTSLQSNRNVVMEIENFASVPSSIVQLADFIIFTSASDAMDEFIAERFVHNSDHATHARLALSDQATYPCVVINNREPRLSVYSGT